MHNLPRWIDYIPFRKSELVWSVTCHCFDLRIWKIYIRNYCPFSFCNFWRNFNMMLKTKVMMISPMLAVWNVIRESEKALTSSNHISANIEIQALKFDPKFWMISSQMGFFVASETLQKKSYSKNATMTCLEQRNPRIQCCDTKC